MRSQRTEQGVTSALVQLFFAWRINILNRNILLVSGVSILAVIGTRECFLQPSALCPQFLLAVCGIGTSVAVNLVPTFTEFHRFESIVVIWLAASAADNLLITIALVRSLVRY